MKILVADDDLITLKVLEELLNTNGFEGTFVDNGGDALTALKTGEFDVVLLDIKMPVVHGVDILKEINRGNTQDADIPVIIISAHAFESEIEWISSFGISRYLTKPFDLDQLINTIRLVAKK